VSRVTATIYDVGHGASELVAGELWLLLSRLFNAIDHKIWSRQLTFEISEALVGDAACKACLLWHLHR